MEQTWLDHPGVPREASAPKPTVHHKLKLVKEHIEIYAHLLSFGCDLWYVLHYGLQMRMFIEECESYVSRTGANVADNRALCNIAPWVDC